MGRRIGHWTGRDRRGMRAGSVHRTKGARKAYCAVRLHVGKGLDSCTCLSHRLMDMLNSLQYLKEPGATFAEATGLVTPLRRPSEPDMARVWLLCYVSNSASVSEAADPPFRSSRVKRFCSHPTMRWGLHTTQCGGAESSYPILEEGTMRLHHPTTSCSSSMPDSSNFFLTGRDFVPKSIVKTRSRLRAPITTR